MNTFNISEATIIGASLTIAASMLYGAYKAGECKGLREVIKAQNRVVHFMVLIVLLPEGIMKKGGKIGKRVFKTYYGFAKGMRIGVAQRKKVSKNGISFDLYRCFQIHVHIGRFSVYLSFDPLLLCGNVDPWYGRNVM